MFLLINYYTLVIVVYSSNFLFLIKKNSQILITISFFLNQRDESTTLTYACIEHVRSLAGRNLDDEGTVIRRTVDNSGLSTNVSNFLDIHVEGSLRSKSLRMPEIPT